MLPRSDPPQDAITDSLLILDSVYRELLTDPAPPSPPEPTDDDAAADEAA